MIFFCINSANISTAFDNVHSKINVIQPYARILEQISLKSRAFNEIKMIRKFALNVANFVESQKGFLAS